MPLKHEKLTLEKIYGQMDHLHHKYLGGDHINVTDFQNAQYFIDVSIGTPA